MGRQVNTYFIGRKDNIVGSTWKGIPYFRFEPDKQNQSPASIESGKLLGLCSSVGAAFRKAFDEAIHPVKTKKAENLFTGALKKWMQTNPFNTSLPTTDIGSLTHFQFNDITSLQDRLRVPISILPGPQQLPVLHIPAFIPAKDIAAPACTAQIHFNCCVACCDIAGKTIAGSYTIQFTLPFTDTTVPAQDIPLSFAPPSQSLTLVVIALQYTTDKNGTTAVIEDKTWMPCGIAAGMVT